MNRLDEFEALVWRITGRRLDPREVAAIVRAAASLRAPDRQPAILRPCGTEAAYRRHLRHGEVPCDKDVAAVRDARAARVRAARAGALPARRRAA
jgi:hypothetical protein